MNARIRAAKKNKMFYEGAPCKACRSTQRYTKTGNCVTCQRDRSKNNQRKVRAEIRAIMKEASKNEK